MSEMIVRALQAMVFGIQKVAKVEVVMRVMRLAY